jgi:hypothetical protein
MTAINSNNLRLSGKCVIVSHMLTFPRQPEMATTLPHAMALNATVAFLSLLLCGLLLRLARA